MFHSAKISTFLIAALELGNLFLVSIFVAPGIFCDSYDGWMMVWLIGEGLLILMPALPWPVHGFSVLPFMGLVCSFLVGCLDPNFFSHHGPLEA